MKKWIGRVSVIIVSIVVMTGSVSFAKASNGQGNGQSKTESKTKVQGRFNVPGYQKKLTNFKEIDGERLHINHRNVKFDTPPVIKEGRTLIPIRVITEALGGQVFWEVNGTQLVTIIDPEGEIMVEFDLSDDNGGHVYIFDAVEAPEYDYDYDNWTFREEASLDVLPGLYENRTYVPLRFIGELFGLGVHYDPWTGLIDILEGPRILIDPQNEAFDYDMGEDQMDPLVIYINENGSPFLEVDDLDYSEDFDDGDYTTRSALELDVDALPAYASQATLVLYLDESVFDEEDIYSFILRFAGGLEDIVRELTLNIED